MITNMSMKPTGWFHVAWSAEIPPGGVKPLKYFGKELVAFRNSKGELSIFDAHCPHMGAHLGYGGKVKNDCLTCPYHGWQFDNEGVNTDIPYEDYTINKKLNKWHHKEQYEMVFLWHDPAGGPPREGWEFTDLFEGHDEIPAKYEDFYPAYSNNAIVYKPMERIHPQMVTENAADSAHFKYTHGAPEDPKIMYFDGSTPIWQSSFGFVNPKTKEVALRTHTRNCGIGLAIVIFNHHGSDDKHSKNYGFNRRLVLAATPVDDEHTDLRVTYFFPRNPDSPDVMPQSVKDLAAGTEELFEQDARMWRHQVFIQRPLFSKMDVEIYTALRKWCDQFYEVEGAPVGPMKIVER